MSSDFYKYLFSAITIIIISTITIISCHDLINNKKLFIKKMKVGKAQFDFNDVTDFEAMKQSNGKENSNYEQFRFLLTKQVNYSNEFVKRFYKIIYELYKYGIEKTKQNKIKNATCSLQYMDQAVERWKQYVKQHKLIKVIDWNNPLNDKQNIPSEYKLNLLNNPKMSFEYIQNNENWINELKENYEITKLSNDVENSDNINASNKNISINNHKLSLNEKEYLSDLCYVMNESLLFFNNKIPEILNDETQCTLNAINHHLVELLLRNNIPISQTKLKDYVEITAKNIKATIHEDIIKHRPYYESSDFENVLLQLNIKSTIDSFIEDSITNWIIGIQTIRFGKNIFISNTDYSEQ